MVGQVAREMSVFISIMVYLFTSFLFFLIPVFRIRFELRVVGGVARGRGVAVGERAASRGGPRGGGGALGHWRAGQHPPPAPSVCQNIRQHKVPRLY